MTFVCGKGGVGKTTVAASLALCASLQKQKTLLFEIDAGSQSTKLLEIQPATSVWREAREHLFIADINPQDAIREYAGRVLRFDALARILTDNPVIHSLLALLPALYESVLLGKIYYHAFHENHEEPVFEHIIIDMPSTGHALAFFDAPQALADMVSHGPMHRNAKAIHEHLINPKQTQIVIVTTPEETPCLEAEMLIKQCTSLRMSIGALVVNRMPHHISEILVDQIIHAPELQALHDAWILQNIRANHAHMHVPTVSERQQIMSLVLPEYADTQESLRIVSAMTDLLAPILTQWNTIP